MSNFEIILNNTMNEYLKCYNSIDNQSFINKIKDFIIKNWNESYNNKSDEEIKKNIDELIKLYYNYFY